MNENCPSSHICSRRLFLKQAVAFSLAVGALAISSPMLVSCSKFSDDSSTDSSVTSEKTGITYDANTKKLTIPFSSDKGKEIDAGGLVTINKVDDADVDVLILQVDSSVKAYSAICPHLETKNQWSVSESSLICADHGSKFASSNGDKMSGLAPKGLTSYNVATASTSYIITVE